MHIPNVWRAPACAFANTAKVDRAARAARRAGGCRSACEGEYVLTRIRKRFECGTIYMWVLCVYLIYVLCASGRLPDKKNLKTHMLDRAEREYALHLLLHGLTPGEWCDECRCICAPAEDAIVAAMAGRPPKLQIGFKLASNWLQSPKDCPTHRPILRF